MKEVSNLQMSHADFNYYVLPLTSSSIPEISAIHRFLRLRIEFVISVEVLFMMIAPIGCDASDFMNQYFLASVQHKAEGKTVGWKNTNFLKFS